MNKIYNYKPIVSSIAKQISEIPIKNNICIAHPLLSINKLEEDDF
jgi:hypothetical protein